MIDTDYTNFCNNLLVNDEIFYRKVGNNIELYSYGCPDSIWDLEIIARCIDQSKLDKEIVFVDTCCAIDVQEDTSKRVVDRITSIYPDKIIYITGCGIEYDREFYKGKGILLDNKEKFNFKKSYPNILKEDINPLDTDHINGFVKIMDGCNYNCAYCAIKNARPHRTFSYEEISQQIRKNLENNMKNIFIFGTEICSYNYNGLNLTRLLKKIINDFPEISIIHLDTLNPGFEDMENLIKLIKEEDKLEKDLDLGIQSCSDTVLKSMRRPYNVNTLRNIIKLGRDLDICFQLLTGFPGESEELFNESLEVIKELAPNRITTCPFSARKNTEAERMSNQIPHHIAEQREQLLIKSVKQISNQEIEKKDIAEFNKFKPINTDNCNIFYVDLYNKEEFVSLFRKLKNINNDKDIVIYCNYYSDKNVKELSTNIKLLIITFGAKVITKFKINDETIKINYPRLLTNDLLSFIEFEFEKLELSTVEDLLTFIRDIKECNLDSKNIISRLNSAGNEELVRMVMNRL